MLLLFSVTRGFEGPVTCREGRESCGRSAMGRCTSGENSGCREELELCRLPQSPPHRWHKLPCHGTLASSGQPAVMVEPACLLLQEGYDV